MIIFAYVKEFYYKSSNLYNVKFYLIILFSFLMGCVGKNSNNISDEVLAEVVNGKMALVIMQTTSQNYKFKPEIETIWFNTNLSGVVFNTRNYRTIYIPTVGLPNLATNYSIEAYVIQPGTYLLKTIKFPVGGQKLFAPEEYVQHHTDTNITFNVSGGEVVYLGNLVFNNINCLSYSEDIVKRIMELKDDYEQVQLSIEKQYPKLSNKLKKRLINIQFQG